MASLLFPRLRQFTKSLIWRGSGVEKSQKKLYPIYGINYSPAPLYNTLRHLTQTAVKVPHILVLLEAEIE